MPSFTPMGVKMEVQGFSEYMSRLDKVAKANANFGKSLKNTSKTAGEAGKSTATFGNRLMTVQSALAGLGLAGVVSQLGQFVGESFRAAAAAERLGAATDSMASAIGSSGDEMVNAITGASNQTISRTDAMLAANKALMFGLVENSDQMEELTQIAVTLGAAMGQNATKSMDDLTTALGRQSPMILDNLGITLKLEEAYKIYANELGKTVDALTEQEKKQAFVNAALIKGKEKVAELGGVTLDTAAQTEQLSAAWADFSVAFGGLLTEMSGGISLLTTSIRLLEDGASAWGNIIESASKVNELTDSLYGTAAAAKASQDSTYGLLGAVNPLAGVTGQLGNIYVGLTDQEKLLVAVQKQETEATIAANKAKFEASVAAGQYSRALDGEIEALTQTEIMAQRYGVEVRGSADKAISAYWDRAAEAKKVAEEEAKAFQESLKAQQEMILGLKTTQAGYFNELRNLQNQAVAGEADFNNQITSIRQQGATQQAEAAAALTEELAQLEQERQDKLHWVMTGAHARTAAENDAALAHWNAHYDELTATATTKATEQTNAIISEQQRAEAATKAAQDREKAELESHLEELKLKTALSMMETSGQLEQLTGLVGISAGEAAELINAGVLPVTQDLGMAIQNTMSGMESSMSQASATATANQDILQQALSGTLEKSQVLAIELEGIGTPLNKLAEDTAPVTQEAMGGMFENIGLMTDTYTQGPVATMETKFLNFNTVTLPQTQMTYTTSFQMMITVTQELIAVVQELLNTISQIGEITAQAAKEVKKAAKEMSEGFKEVAKTIEKDLWPAIKEAIKLLERLEHQATTAQSAINQITGTEAASVGGSDGIGLSRGIGHKGWGLQSGLGLGFAVPSGFPNDSFGPLFVESGEEVLVTPRGSSIDQVVMDRLSSMPVQSSMTNYYFNMTVNTGADAAAVIQQYEVMQAMLPN